jgi:hypothetical protein
VIENESETDNAEDNDQQQRKDNRELNQRRTTIPANETATLTPPMTRSAQELPLSFHHRA